MQPQTDVVERTTHEALERLKAVSDLDGLEEWRVSVLGRNGALTQILRGLGSAPKEERPRLGAAANSAKTVLEEHLTEREQELKRPPRRMSSSGRAST